MSRTQFWAEIAELAAAAGSRWPDLVAAQAALESAWGREESGRHNLFGLKGQGTVKPTEEELPDGTRVPIDAEFLDFGSRQEAVEYLVSRWYQDFKGYRGVNNADTIEQAADMLRAEGYATDSAYPEKLKRLLRQYGGKGKGAAGTELHKPVKLETPLFTMLATQDTWLKKRAEQAAALAEGERVAVERGRRYGVVRLEELPGDAHNRVSLAAGAGDWVIFTPHWRRENLVPPSSSGGAVAPAVDWSNFADLVTPNLSVGEVLQWDARRRPRPGSNDERRILATAQQFQAIRTAWNRPLGVTSFYRPEPINSQVGGVPGSRHVTGEAFDLYPVGMPIDAFYQWISVRWTGGLGDGRHRGFIHLDTRNGGRFVPGAGVRPYVEFGY